MISGISATSTSGAIGVQRQPAAERLEPASVRADAAAPSTSIVAVESARETPRLERTHPDAAFVVHLIATIDGAPQTRHLRRTSAAEGTARYAAARKSVSPARAGKFSDVA